MTNRPTDAHRDILAFLKRLRQRLVAATAADALFLGATAACVLWLFWFAAEAFLYMSPAWRLAGGGLVLALPVGVAVGYLWRHLAGSLSPRSLGLFAERRCPELAERLTSALELWPSQRARRLYSTDLLAAILAEAAAILSRLQPGDLIDRESRPLLVRRLALAGAALLACLLIWDDLPGAAYRCVHPTRAFERPVRTHVALLNPPLEAVRGDDVAIDIRFSGSLPRTAVISRRVSAEAPWQRQEVVVDEGFFASTSSMFGGQRADTLTYVFEDVRRSFDYQVEAGDGRTPVRTLTVIDPPVVQHLRLAYTYPVYSGLPPRIEEESGDIHTLAGTRVNLRVVATKPLASAALVIDDTLRLPMTAVDDGASLDLELMWRAAADSTRGAHTDVADGAARASAGSVALHLHSGEAHSYYVELIDRKDIANRDPIRYALRLLEDLPPRVAIVDPGRDADLPESQQLVLAIEAGDDFGVGSVELLYSVGPDGPRQVQRLPLPAGDGRQLELAHLWDVTELGLLPEDRVFYRLRVWDNDSVRGPKSTVSRQHVLRMPSLYEIMEEVALEQERAVMTLEELAAEERDTGEYLKQVRRELLKTEELSWEQKKELEAALDREEERARAVAELAEQMARTAEKLQEQGLGSEEILSRLQEIRELMAEVMSPELQEALEELRQAVDELDPRELAAAIREFSQDQEAFQQRLERTLELLRRVHAEQRLEAAVAQAADLRDRQQQINEGLDREPVQGDGRLQAQEKRLQGDTDRLQQELEDLAESLKPLNPQTAASLSDWAQSMHSQELSARMREMIQRMQAGQRQEARRLGKGVEEDLGVLQEGLDHLKGSFTAEEKARLLGELRRAMGDLVALSMRQEELHGRVADLHRSVPTEFAEDQFALLRGTGHVIDRIAGLSEKTLSLDFGLATTLGYALRSMRQSGHHLGQRQASRSAAQQLEAMGYLNEAVLLLRESADNVARSKMPSGFAEAMQKMMGLSQQQAALNEATQQTLGEGAQQGQQGRGRDPRTEMARLAAQQRRIYQALGELERGLRGHRGAQKRVEAIEREMESVLRQMNRRKPDPQLARSQERILQRMLDASRSIHTRGFEKKRRSESGVDQAYAGPVWLPAELGQSRDRWREAMKRALEGDYPREYLELMRRYYELVYQDISGSEDQLP